MSGLTGQFRGDSAHEPAADFRLVIRVADTPDATAEDVKEVFIVESPYAELSPEGLLDEVIEVLAGGEATPSYVAEETRHRYEWGAEHGTVEVLLTIALAVFSNATWDLVKNVIARKGFQVVSPEFRTLPSRDEVAALAKWYVEASYGAPFDALEIVDQVEQPGESWSIAMLHGHTRYEVEYRLDEHGLVLVRERRVEVEA